MRWLIFLAVFALAGCEASQEGELVELGPTALVRIPVPPTPEAFDDGPDPPRLIAPMRREVAFDDGRGRYLQPGHQAGNAVGVRFDVPEGTRLDAVSFRVDGDGFVDALGRTRWRSHAPFELQILAVDTDGTPGATVLTHGMEGIWIDPKPAAGAGLLRIDLGALDLRVPPAFFVVMRWPEAPGPTNQALGFDGSDPDERTWVALEGVWQPAEYTKGFGALDAMIRIEVTAPGGSMAQPPRVLRTIEDDCMAPGGAGAWPESAGQWVATRVTAPERLLVKAVNLQLLHWPDRYLPPPFDGVCDATTPLRVELHRGYPDNPPIRRMGYHPLQVKVRQVDGDPSHQVRLPVNPPLALSTGEHLFIMVEMARAGEKAACLRTCRSPANAGTDFWSTLTGPPFKWVPFEAYDVGGSSNLDVEVLAVRR